MASSQETLRRLAIFDEGFVTAGSGHDLATTPAPGPKTARCRRPGCRWPSGRRRSAWNGAPPGAARALAADRLWQPNPSGIIRQSPQRERAEKEHGEGEGNMQIHLTPKKGSRRFAGAAVAVSALAIMLGLIPAASAHTVAPAGPTAARSASAAAAANPGACAQRPQPAGIRCRPRSLSETQRLLYPSRDGATTSLAAPTLPTRSLASSRIRRQCRSRLTTICG